MPAVFIREMEQYIKYSIFFILKIGWLKGKQVRFLYDLVTVIREYTSKRRTEQCFVWEGGICVMIFQPGNLPVVWYREIFPGSRVIGRTVNVGCQIVSLFMQTYYSALK